MDTADPSQKLTAYFQEGQRMWQKTAALVVSRKFYELWESAFSPLPFLLTKEGILCAGERITVPGKMESCQACPDWEEQTGCAVLRLESEGLSCGVYQLRFSPEGMPQITFLPPENIKQTDSLKYEAANLIIGKLQSAGRELDFTGYNKHAFWKLLDLLPPGYPAEAAKALRILKLGELRAVFEKALSDRASDELGSQMELPLFGTYSRPQNVIETEILNKTDFRPALTFWQVSRLLELLSETDQLMFEFERNFELAFKDAKVIGGAHPKYILSLDAPEGAPVFFEDILEVRRRSDLSAIGSFRVDFFDGVQIIGCLTVESAEKINRDLCEGVGTLIRGPSKFLKERLDEVRRKITPECPEKNLNAGSCLIGFSPVPFQFPEGEDFPDLNASQAMAFQTAVCEKNPLVLIQGPPGTGKTHVLRRIVRALHAAGKRILITAPSHAAVDNLCRGLSDLPYLRCGRHPESIAPDIVKGHWIGDREIVRKMHAEEKAGHPILYAGTHPALLKNYMVKFDAENIGPFDVILFDEAGMSSLEEVFLCSTLAKRAVLLGDYKQLPPFPRPKAVLEALSADGRILESGLKAVLSESAMEWLVRFRKCPSIRLNISYRCRNPRLLRFISGSFYDAGLKPDPGAEYYQLPLPEREKRFSPATLRWITTSKDARRGETVLVPGKAAASKPGICNRLEADLCVKTVQDYLTRYPLREITVISPYRAQIMLIRQKLSSILEKTADPAELEFFLASRVSTVDSFQGGESDAVVISYVRSNPEGRIGFTDHPNRINVAHTRCRYELTVIGDLDCLKQKSGNQIFQRLEQAFCMDGEIIPSSEVLKHRKHQPNLL